MTKKLTIYVDGAARGNPGPAGAGGLILDANGKTIDQVCKYLGEITNNKAEYQALILALEKAVQHDATKLEIFSDSELMVNQLNYKYKVKNKDLKLLFIRAHELLKEIEEYKISHIPREENKKADKLANMAIDGQEF